MRVAWIGITSVAAVALFGAHSATASDGASELLRAPMLQTCAVSCRACTSNPFQHQVTAAPLGEHLGNYHDFCANEPCATAHPPCPSPSFAGLEESEKQEVWAALTEGDEDAIRHTLHEHGRFIEVNTERQMVQILDCGGDHVVANIPISSRLASKLAAVAD